MKKVANIEICYDDLKLQVPYVKIYEMHIWGFSMLSNVDWLFIPKAIFFVILLFLVMIEEK